MAEVNNALCKGCGACVSACRGNAIDLLGFTNEEIISAISALSEEKDKMKKGIQCENCLECTEVGDV